MSLLKYGTIVLAIHHIALFNKFYPSTTFQSPPIRHLLLASLVNKAKAIDFHLVLASPSLLFLLELIFSDVWGPSPVLSTSGNKYYVSFVDHYSRYVWLFPISNKSDVLSIFCAFQNMVERMFDRKIIAVQIDWGSEFRSLHKFFVTKGIQHRLTCPHTSQQNGIVERRHRNIVEIGLSLLSHSSVPLKHWDDAFLMATYLLNRLPT